MGQATVDLPDPLDSPAAAKPLAEPLADADDLLAQLAGDEIDRLLAEAEVDLVPRDGASAPAAPTVRAPGPATAAAGDALPGPGTWKRSEPVAAAGSAINAHLEAEIDALFDELQKTAPKPSAAATPPAPAAPAADVLEIDADPFDVTQAASPEDTVAAVPAVTESDPAPEAQAVADPDAVRPEEVDDAIARAASELMGETAAHAAASDLPAAAAASPVPAAPVAAVVSPVREPVSPGTGVAALAAAEIGTSSDERTALADREGVPDAAGAAAASAPIPPLLRPLVWINAPFAALPDGVRDALGKVAILTLMNAIAVLAYVIVFRKG
jgi:hypothetical protein